MIRFRHSATTAAALVFLAMSTWAQPPEGTEDPMEQADALFQAGRFADAERAYKSILDDDAANGRAALRLGEIALLGNQFVEAERRLKRAIELRPDDKRPKLLLAETYYRQDRLVQAADLYRAGGQEVAADTLASFKGLTPYEITGKAETTRLKFVQTDPLPVIRARFNGSEEGLLLIDTGAAELFLDTRFAEKLGVPQFGSTTGTFAGGKRASIGHGRLDSIQLGEFEIKNLPVIVKERQPLGIAPGGETPVGVIGTVVFYHFFATLDYPNGELVLRRKTDGVRAELARQAQAPSTHVVPFWMAGKHFMVAWGTVNDSEPLLMFADTGLARGGFLCPQSTLKGAGIDLSGRPSFEGMGGGGPVKVTPFTVEKLTFGDASRSNVQSLFGGFPPSTEHQMGFRVGGIISHGFFRAYALTFDFERMQFYLTPG